MILLPVLVPVAMLLLVLAMEAYEDIIFRPPRPPPPPPPEKSIPEQSAKE
ncbi:hypothetical protein [Streptomyces anandii]|uniref:Uncharacterized protein n=1 Tax=Streptomyces anandii TaxID=285454 RepID=A0ABW6H8V1_9ACTN|nr:hypothetical protein [Streptomyces anandii]GGX77138.1 hypothetical protein GCM10010510_22490 [Streptomyces anandii JCM 4720]